MAESSTMEQLKRSAAKVSQALNADIYVVSGPMYPPAEDEMSALLSRGTPKPNALVLLTTFGGLANVSYCIGRALRHCYSGTDRRLVMFIHTKCKSAGTLLAIAADELVMSGTAELGPLDVQMRKPDELGDVISGLTPVQALEFLEERTFDTFEYFAFELIKRSLGQITTRTAFNVADTLMTELFRPIYAQLDPNRLGEYHRNMLVAMEYGKRLNAGNLRLGERSLRELVYNYPSHDFWIDRAEAESLFSRVRPPTDDERALANLLQDVIASDMARESAAIRKIDVT
jgi:hypothetical protein